MGDSTNYHAAASELLRANADAERAHAATAEHLDRGRYRTIRLARTYGMSWDDIGAALGITGVAARVFAHRYERGL